MIKEIRFKNFKALRDTTLPLSQLTLMVGPNGSGKSTALLGLTIAAHKPDYRSLLSADARSRSGAAAEITYKWGRELDDCAAIITWSAKGKHLAWANISSGGRGGVQVSDMEREIHGIKLYSLDAQAIARPHDLQPSLELVRNGLGLPVVLDRLRDQYPERFEAINEELSAWLPEFDRILFETPGVGNRAVALRTRLGQHTISAKDVSQGTLLALAILTLAYLPDPPPIVCLEEPDRGIHPRLLRDVRDAMYRLAYPEQFGEKRKPVQVIATTHSPYMLDLFRDHPEEIVLAHKEEGNVIFERLSDRPDLDEILRDTHLGDAWYSGILGGVPTDR